MRLRGLIFLLALPSLACESSLSPDAVAGTYVLRRVEGDSLPAVLYTTDNSRVWVLSDTLVFRANGQGTRSSRLVIEPLNSERPNEPSAREQSFGFRVVGSSIEVGYYCPDANCIAPPHLMLRWTDNGLVSVRSAPMLTYERTGTR